MTIEVRSIAFKNGTSRGVPEEFCPRIGSYLFLVRRYILEIVKRFGPNLHGDLLDFGCGSKPYRQLLTVDRYLGLDYENPGHSHEGEDIDLFYDGKRIPLDDASVDSILSTEVLEHVPDIRMVLKEWHRVLKPGGSILFTTPFVWPLHEVPYDFGRYTAICLRQFSEEAGFVVYKQVMFGHPVHVLAQMALLYLQELEHIGVARTGKVIGRITRVSCKILTIGINALSLVLSKALPDSPNIYLGNALCLEKDNPGEFENPPPPHS